MKYRVFELTSAELAELAKDLEEWAGSRVQVTQLHDNKTTNAASKLRYGCQVGDDFFCMFPRWRAACEG